MITRQRNMQGKRRKPSRVRTHLKRLQTAPLKRWRDGQAVVSVTDKSIAARRVESLLVPYVFAIIAQKNRKVMSAFLNCGFFEGHPPKAKDILQRSVEWHFGCRTKKGSLYDRCWTYTRAMEKAFADGMDIENLAILLHDGIENLSRCKTVSESIDHVADIKDETEDQDQYQDEDKDDVGDEDEKDDVKTGDYGEEYYYDSTDKEVDNPQKPDSPAHVRKKREAPFPFDFTSDIVVNGKVEHIETILGAGIKTRLRIDVIVDDIDENNWTELKVLKLRMLK